MAMLGANDTIFVGNKNGFFAAPIEKEPVPEPGSVLGILALAIGLAGLLLKRTMNRKKAVTVS